MPNKFKFFNLKIFEKSILNIFLHFVTCFLLTSCVSNKVNDFRSNIETDFPPNDQFSLPSNEQNKSNNLIFQSLGLNHQLFNLIEQALKENPGWLVKLAKVDLARAKAGHHTVKSKLKMNSSLSWISGKERTRESKFKTQKVPDWHSRGNIGWELDLWGKWDAHRKEAESYIDAELYIQKGAQLTLIYEIAKLWYQNAYLKEDLLLIKNQIRNHHEVHVLHLHNYHAGLDDNQSLITMENTIKLLVLDYNQKKRELMVCQTQLGSLIGNPLDFNDSNTVQFSEEPIPHSPHNLPSNALKNRPDILEAQARFIAQFQHAKGSSLNLYPSINLNLSSITMSGDLSKPFEQWKVSGGPVIDIPIWSPQRQTELRVAERKLKVMKLEWKNTVLKAVQEIESSLIIHQSLSEDLKIAQNLESKYSQIEKLTANKFNSGLVSKIDLLENISASIEAKRETSASKLNYIFSFFNLSKSLGINWG